MTQVSTLEWNPERRGKLAGLLLLPVSIAILFLGLRPLNFRVENQVHWIEGRNGVQFHGVPALRITHPGIVYGQGVGPQRDRSSIFEPITLELLLEARAEADASLAQIFSVYDESGAELLRIGQWESGLEIRSRDIRQKADERHSEVDLEGALPKNEKTLITIVSGEDRTRLYVDGMLTKTIAKPELIGFRHFRGRLFLGNSPNAERPWLGNLYGLALYHRCLSEEEVIENYLHWTGHQWGQARLPDDAVFLYAFNEGSGNIVQNLVNPKDHLEIPSTLSFLPRKVLRPFWKTTDWDKALLGDILRNVLAFMPFGLCIAAYMVLTWHIPWLQGALIAVVAGAVLSLLIELAQVLLPGRDSSSLDVVCNTLGTALGVGVFRTAVWCFRGPAEHVPQT